MIFHKPRTLILALCFSFLMIGLSPVAFQLLAAPMPNGGAQFVKFMTGAESFGKTVDYFMGNLRLFFEGDRTEKNQRVQMLVAVGYSAIFLLSLIRRKDWKSLETTKNRALIGIIFLLAAYVGATLAMYLVGGQADYRVFSAPLLFSLMLLLVLEFPGRLFLTICILVLNFFTLPAYLANFSVFRNPNYLYDSSEITRFKESTKSHLAYVAGANPWCNTVLSGGLEPWVYADMAGLPAGFGVQGVWNWKYMTPPLKSKYVLLDQRSVDGEKVADYLPMMKVIESDAGVVKLQIERYGVLSLRELTRLTVSNQPYVLYENLDSQCERKSL